MLLFRSNYLLQSLSLSLPLSLPCAVMCTAIVANMNTSLVISLSLSLSRVLTLLYMCTLMRNNMLIWVRVLSSMTPCHCLWPQSMCYWWKLSRQTPPHTHTHRNVHTHSSTKPLNHPITLRETLVSNIIQSSVTNIKEPGDWQVARQLWFIKWGVQLLLHSPLTLITFLLPALKFHLVSDSLPQPHCPLSFQIPTPLCRDREIKKKRAASFTAHWCPRVRLCKYQEAAGVGAGLVCTCASMYARLWSRVINVCLLTSLCHVYIRVPKDICSWVMSILTMGNIKLV